VPQTHARRARWTCGRGARSTTVAATVGATAAATSASSGLAARRLTIMIMIVVGTFCTNYGVVGALLV
jgi:hypothetical protein